MGWKTLKCLRSAFLIGPFALLWSACETQPPGSQEFCFKADSQLDVPMVYRFDSLHYSRSSDSIHAFRGIRTATYSNLFQGMWFSAASRILSFQKS
jgi:hypothetical protein